MCCSLHSVRPVIDHLMNTKGKRLRPLVCLASGMCFGPATDATIDVASAVELVHMASLVHDDVIDRASMRRGVRTVNSVWGNHVAVLLGDMMLSNALGLVARYAACGVLSSISSAVARMCESEMAQANSRFDPEVTEEEYMKRIEGKTAALLEASCVSGALVSGAAQEQARCLARFGRLMGLAFQVTDDLLDFIADPDDLGKPTCQDLRQGIITLPAVYLLSHPAHGRYIREAISTRTLGKKMRRIGTLLDRSGALEMARNKVRALLDEAARHLEQIGECAAKHALRSCLDMIQARMDMRLSEKQFVLSLDPTSSPEKPAQRAHQT